MYKYAQIQDGIVWGIMEHEADIDTLYEKYFSKYIEFVDITDTPNVQEGWRYEDGIFIDNTPTKEELVVNRLTSLDDKYNYQFSELVKSLGLASLDNNTSLVTELQAEYLELKIQYQQERGDILSE